MGIKLDHVHEDGKRCYVPCPHRPLIHLGLYRLGGQEFAVAFMAYTGSWYAYNPETGKEVATLSREFYKAAVKPFLLNTLIPDPDCVPAGAQ